MSNLLFRRREFAGAPRDGLVASGGNGRAFHLAVANLARELIRARAESQVEADLVSSKQGLFDFHFAERPVRGDIDHLIALIDR